MQLRTPRALKGFLLVEVLVALLLAGLAVVSLAAAHAAAVRQTRMGQNRALAAQRAVDLAERMRANRAGLLPVDGSASPYGLGLSWAAQQSLGADGQAQACDGPLVTCSPSQFAQADMAQWRVLLGRTLPSGAGWVQVDALAGLADVWVAWADPLHLRSDEAPRTPGECPLGMGIDAASGVRCLHARVAW